MDIILKRLFSFMVVLFVGVSMFAGGTIKNVKKKAVDTQMTDETAPKKKKKKKNSLFLKLYPYLYYFTINEFGIL